MLIRFFMILPLLSLLATGCAALPSLVKPALEDQGEVSVYLHPFPRDAGRLMFTIDHLSAVDGNGNEFPLVTAMHEFKGGEMQRQRRIASGVLPPGRYVGLSTVVNKAVLKREEGEADLLVPEDPVRIDFAFDIMRKKATVLSLVFHYAESVQTGFSFTPSFTLSVPSLPAGGLLGYAVNRDDNSVTVFDKKSGQVASIIATGKGPDGLAFDRIAGKVYVSLADEDAIEVIDVAEGRLSQRFNLTIGDSPHELVLTPDGRFLLSVNTASRTLSIIDPLDQVELSRVSLGEGSRNLLVGPNGIRCYVFNSRANTLSVIDIPNSAIVATISLEDGPVMGQFNRKGDRLYVIHEGSPYLLVIDTSSLSVVKRVFVGPGLSVIKVDSATDRIYGYRKQDVRVEVYDPFSLLPVEYLAATSGIVYMAIDGDENNLYLVSSEKNRLMSINLTSKKVVLETDVGENPSRVTLMGER